MNSLQTFKYLFGVIHSERYFGITDSLSWSLQGQNVSTFDANHATETVCRVISGLGTDAEFNTFWKIHVRMLSNSICQSLHCHVLAGYQEEWILDHILMQMSLQRFLQKNVLRICRYCNWRVDEMI